MRIFVFVLMVILVGCSDPSAEATRAKLIAEATNDDTARAGRAYLEQNSQREGVVVTPSGLQYEVLVATEGATPGPASSVTAHYEGRLISGEVFDSSIERGAPLEFPLGRVIKGWQEGLQLMSPGSKYRFHVPAALAYGARSPTPLIPPNSVLVFDVELISFD